MFEHDSRASPGGGPCHDAGARAWVRAAVLGIVLTVASAAILLAPAAAGGEAEVRSPSATPARGEKHMVSAANLHASRAGLDILRRGGSAVDAAIAMQMVLGLVEPQSSGIGGGAFLLHFEAATGALVAFDGRETAPAKAGADLFLGPDGRPIPFFQAVVGGRSVGAPGLLRMLELAHRAHGTLPWSELFEPAIELAEGGFAISPRLAMLIAGDNFLATQATARAYFYRANGTPKAAGEMLVNKALAHTYRVIAAKGAEAFYEGEVARDIVRAVREAPVNPGRLAVTDLAGYQAKARRALCARYRVWKVCGAPPPTSGGVTVLQILGILENTPIAAARAGSLEAVRLISEASRLAYADRAKYLADSDFVEVPVTGLLDRGYLRRRARMIRAEGTMGKAEAGTPPQREGLYRAPGRSYEAPSTTHLSVVDGKGNAVAMTSSIENVFGSRLMVRGFLLNNQLTDFSFLPAVDGVPVANRVEPGKRPRSSMAPTLVLDREGKLVLVVGSPGGSRIIAYVALAVIAVLDWGLDAQQAVDLPHHVNRNGATDLERGTALEALVPALRALGHEVRLRSLVSGLHTIRVTPRGLEGGADPRREGVALGD